MGQRGKHIHDWLEQQYGTDTKTAIVSAADIESITKKAGSYLLLFDLVREMSVNFRDQGQLILSPGLYVYSGSAHGPGGLRARVGRHLRGRGKLHWNIDQITHQCPPVSAFVIPGGPGDLECALIAEISENFPAEVPIPGFGAADCRRCKSHFLALPKMDAGPECD